MKYKALFLYVHVSGHKKAAEAIGRALTEVYPDTDTLHYEALAYAYPLVGKVVSSAYMEILRRTPALWDYLYDNQKVVQATKEIRQLLNALNAPKLNRLIRTHNPSCLVCTHAVPCSVLCTMKRRGRLRLPVVGVITDFAVHSYWLFREVDAYFVPTDAIKREMVRRGIRESIIYVTGMPVDPRFNKSYNRGEEKARLKLDPDRQTVLLMGGSAGLLPMNELVAALHSGFPRLQILAVTGMNRRIFREMKARYADTDRVRVFGYYSQIHRLMAAADLLISKPGGLTSAEALCQGLPLLLINPIPGQEERNSRYLISQGVAQKVLSPGELTSTLKALLGQAGLLQEMSRKCLQIARPNAAYVAADIVHSLAIH